MTTPGITKAIDILGQVISNYELQVDQLRKRVAELEQQIAVISKTNGQVDNAAEMTS